MKLLIIFLTSFLWFSTPPEKIVIDSPLNFIALGDSYTIGQGIDYNSNWPNQLTSILRTSGIVVYNPKIVAKTGWRTDDLIRAIKSENLTNDYNLVSLLIGVNNQFQGSSIEQYKSEFEQLLNKAIDLANNDHTKVFVLSIPDYAYTPFGSGNQQVSNQIDLFNEANFLISKQYSVRYINITEISRMGLNDPSLVAADGLHPSANQYQLWVNRIMNNFELPGFATSVNNKPNADISIIQNGPYLDVTTNKIDGIVKIYDILGNLKKSEKFQGTIQLSVGNLTSGIYIFVLHDDKKDVYRKKIFIQ